MGFLTTDRPKLWFGLLGGLVLFCAFCGGTLTCIGAEAGKEVAWFALAQRSVRDATVPPPDEMALIKRVQAGEKLTGPLVDDLAKAAAKMSERTRSGWAALQAQPCPERLGPMKAIAKTGFEELEVGWNDMSDAIARRDVDGVKLAYARMEKLGARVEADVRMELEKLYGPKSAEKIPLTSSDPARP